MATNRDDVLAELAVRVAATSSGFTLPTTLPASGMSMLKEWLGEEVKAQRTANPNAMSVATIDADGTLSNRIVLCRGVDVEVGSITFFTNYRGRKGRALLREGWEKATVSGAGAPTPQQAAACLHWDASDRQARVEGLVMPCSAAASDAYFSARRWESRLAAWASDQSEPIGSREALLAKLGGVCEKLKLDPQELLERGNDVVIPRPAHWGGFNLFAKSVELWMGGPGRMHDRAVWRRAISMEEVRAGGGALATKAWNSTRLQP
jgi:pyridoxamine 5'-phosphate oxidase